MKFTSIYVHTHNLSFIEKQQSHFPIFNLTFIKLQLTNTKECVFDIANGMQRLFAFTVHYFTVRSVNKLTSLLTCTSDVNVTTVCFARFAVLFHIFNCSIYTHKYTHNIVDYTICISFTHGCVFFLLSFG